MDTSLLENYLTFDLNSAPARNTSDARKTDFEDGHDLVADESKSTSWKEEPDILIDKLNQLKSENKKLTETLIFVSENYNTLRRHLSDLVQKYSGDELPSSRKRNFEADNAFDISGNDGRRDCISEEGGSPKRPREMIMRTNISRAFVRVDPSDTSLAVKDGYHWRKYGQKVTKDNPSPRAYYKCSFSPSCQVKKKVQKSIGDPSILVATYEGEHNHQHPLRTEILVSSVHGPAAALSPSLNCFEISRPKETFDFMDSGSCNNYQRSVPEIEGNSIQQFMVEQMASSLTRNPSFTAALAAAISGRILSHDSGEK